MVAAVAVKLLPFIEQPVPVTVNRNAPVPEPPVVVRSTDVPVVFVKTEFEIVKVGWNVHDLNPCRGPKEKLLKLERIDKKIIWDLIEYKVDKYPLASIHLTVKTISDQRSWIGV